MSIEILCDTHCHTTASTHAYSTVMEYVQAAAEKGLEAIAITNHGPSLQDGAHIYHFSNLKELPRRIRGVWVLRGAEVNVMDCGGRLDIPDPVLRKLDWVIVSMHESTYPPKTVEEHTETWLNVAKNPLVDVIGHCGQESYRFDYETVIPELGRLGKLVEINDHSPLVRPGSEINCPRILRLCKKHGVRVVVNSDAHFCEHIGCFENAKALLEEAEYPPELIVNLNADRLLDYISEKKGIHFDRESHG